MESNQSVYFNVTFIGNESSIEEIHVSNSEINITLPIILNVSLVSNVSAINTSATGRTNYYCAELNGIICSASEVCSETTVVSLDGYCCKGKCEVQQSGSGNAWIGYLIGFLLLAGLGYLVIRYRKKAPNAQEIFKRKVAEAQKKMP